MASLDILPLVPYQASKWLKIQALLTDAEMELLLVSLEPVYIYNLSGFYEKPTSLVSTADFIKKYDDYLQNRDHHLMASALTATPEALYAQQTAMGYMVRIQEPVVQMQSLEVDFSHEEKVFKTNLFGSETISWGLQFSFPHLFQTHRTRDVFKVSDPERFPNVAVFKGIQRWMRENTVPASFNFNGEKIVAPFRIGKQAIAWACTFPSLAKKGLKLLHD